MSQVNPIPKGNGIWDGEQIAPRWCWTGQETLEEKKLPCSNTIEDIAVIFAVSRVFIIDFPLWHNGWAIMKSLSFLSFCDVRWWGHWLKVAEAMDCIVHAGNGQRLRTYEQSILGSTVHSKETRTYNKHCCIVTLFCICEFTAFSEIQFVFF